MSNYKKISGNPFSYKDFPPYVIPLGFKPKTFRTGI